MVLWRQFTVIAQMCKVHIILFVHICVRHEIGSHKELILPLSFFYFLSHTLFRVSGSILCQRTKIMYDLIKIKGTCRYMFVGIFYWRREAGQYFISVHYLFWHRTHHKIVTQLLVLFVWWKSAVQDIISLDILSAQSFSLLLLDDWLHRSEGKQFCWVCPLPLVTAALAVGRLVHLHKKSSFSINAVVGLLLGIKKGLSQSNCHLLKTPRPLYLRIAQHLIWCSDPASMGA